MGQPNDLAVLDLFASICDRTASVTAANTDWGESGRRDGQYSVDLDTDDMCVGPLLDAGYSVLSEESGLQHPSGDPSPMGTVVVDPLDGSTNASLGLPWFATSLCLVIDGTPMVSMVANLPTGARYAAIRGSGAVLDGEPIVINRLAPLDDAIIAISGLADHHFGWRQFRAMGASALDLCAVGAGSFDGFVDMSPDAHGVWDYLGALLVVEEAGGVMSDVFGRDLVVLDHAARRTPIAASHPALHDDLRRHRAFAAAEPSSPRVAPPAALILCVAFACAWTKIPSRPSCQQRSWVCTEVGAVWPGHRHLGVSWFAGAQW